MIMLCLGWPTLDYNFKALLVEAGKNNLTNPWVYRSAIFPVT